MHRRIDDPIQGQPVLTAARCYATKLGWQVFPVPPGTKQSYKSEATHGTKWGRTKDIAEIEADWLLWPEANVGIPTGLINGFFVVDGDTLGAHGVDGIANMEALGEQHGGWPETLMAMSPSGSLHRYYDHPGAGFRIYNSASELAPGVDVRGDGGIIIAPPSVKGDGVYRWLNWGTPIAPAPGWLLALVTRPERQSVPGGVGAGDVEFDKLAAALEVIPNDVGWEQWNNIGMAIWRSTSGSDQGFALFDRWSAKNSIYDATRTAKRWDGLHRWPPDRINGASILWIADQVAPGWRRQFDKQRRLQQMSQNREIGEGIDPLSLKATILTVNQMLDRLVWIGESGAVIDKTTGLLRKDDKATKEYAASTTLINNKRVKNLDLWMGHPDRTRVDVLAWAPGQSMFCAPPEGEGTAFNTWRGLTDLGVPVPSNWKELAKPFMDHLDYLVPIREERQRFVQWLGHMFQYPWELPHTCYLMVTPTHGIGRNWMMSVLTRALRGHVAAGVNLPELLDGGFNGRLSHKLLAFVDELKEGPGGERYKRAQNLKTIVTQEVRHINPKYGVQSQEKNCCRWVMLSQHHHALPFENDDRRVVVIENPTDCKEAAYYTGLYALLDDMPFIASVRQLMMSVDLMGFNAGAHAPLNDAKRRAIAESKTDIERKLEEFKEECWTPLVSRKVINGLFINSFGKPEASSMAVTLAMASVGMVNTEVRIKDGNGVKHSVVIVKVGEWTKERVKQAETKELRQAMEVAPFVPTAEVRKQREDGRRDQETPF